MAVRRQLLERELNKLGFRKKEAGRAASSSEVLSQQESQAFHPHADDDAGQHGE